MHSHTEGDLIFRTLFDGATGVSRLAAAYAEKALLQSKKEFRCKLQKARICTGRCTGNDAKICVITRAAGRIGRCELRPIQQIKKLHTYFKSCAILAAEKHSLEKSKVQVIHPVGAQRRIDA